MSKKKLAGVDLGMAFKQVEYMTRENPAMTSGAFMLGALLGLRRKPLGALLGLRR
jgi:hypothetical protein|tara:strand:- start:437 stop:601 length:165 start_codon:yes stop_codon:yes gene_type:complete